MAFLWPGPCKSEESWRIDRGGRTGRSKHRLSSRSLDDALRALHPREVALDSICGKRHHRVLRHFLGTAGGQAPHGHCVAYFGKGKSEFIQVTTWNKNLLRMKKAAMSCGTPQWWSTTWEISWAREGRTTSLDMATARSQTTIRRYVNNKWRWNVL